MSNVVAKLTSEGTGRIFNVLLSVLGARMLGPARWGLYWSAFGIAQLAALGTDLGGHLTLARNVARAPRTGWKTLALTAGPKGVLIVVAGLTLLKISSSLAQPAPVMVMVSIAALLLSLIEWLGCFLRGLGRVREEALVLGGTAVVACAAGGIALAFGADMTGLAASQAMAMLVALAATAGWIVRIAPPPAGFLRGFGSPAGPFLRAALPTGIAIMISMTSWRLVYLLASFSLPTINATNSGLGEGLTSDLGHYATAHRLLEIGRFLPAAVAAALFPSFVATRGSLSPGRALLPLAGITTVAAIALSLPHVAPMIMLGIFGFDYAAAGPALAVFAWALPFMCVNAVLTTWLVARGHVLTNAGLSCLHLVTHAFGLLVLPALLGADSVHDAVIAGYPLRGADLLALGLVFAEASLSVGTLIAWRRLK